MSGLAQMDAVVNKERVRVIPAGGDERPIGVRQAGAAVFRGVAAGLGQLLDRTPTRRGGVGGDQEHIGLPPSRPPNAVHRVGAGAAELCTTHPGVPVVPSEKDRDQIRLGDGCQPAGDQDHVLTELRPADRRIDDRHVRSVGIFQPLPQQIDPADLAVGPVPLVGQRIPGRGPTPACRMSLVKNELGESASNRNRTALPTRPSTKLAEPFSLSGANRISSIDAMTPASWALTGGNAAINTIAAKTTILNTAPPLG